MASQPTQADDKTTITIEAATVEEALGRLSTELGPGARILRADRVRRGGLAGFFAREVVEIEAESPDTVGAGVADAFDRMLAAAESGTDSAPPAGTPLRSIAAPALPDAPVFATVGWDSSRMLEIGLPGALVQAVAALDPSDDLGHLSALTAELSPVCGPLPAGPARLVGDRAVRLRSAVPIEERLDGYIHLVVGDELPTTLPGVPSVVSWVTDRGSARAVSLALGTGARLGYGMGTAFGAPARRISALDAAIAVRDLMERL